jgi:hypothetical protein
VIVFLGRAATRVAVENPERIAPGKDCADTFGSSHARYSTGRPVEEDQRQFLLAH